MTAKTSLPCLLLAQAQVAFNDNAAKFMLAGLATLLLPTEKATVVVCILAALLVLPFVLFAPLVGWIADRFSKRRVLNLALVFQVLVMIWIFLAVRAHSLNAAVAGFALLAIQASVFSPSKYGIVKELTGSARLGMAMGWMEMLTIVAILLGGFWGGRAIDDGTAALGSPWAAASKTILILGAASVGALLIFQGVEPTQPRSPQAFQWSLLWNHFREVAELWRARPLRLSALGVAYFYSFGGILYLTLFQFGRELHAGGGGGAKDAGVMLALLGGGVAGGSLLASAFCRRRIELGLVPIGGLGIALMLAVAGFCAKESLIFRAGLVVMGLFAGLFTVPLNAFLQDRAGDGERGRVMAATNLLTNIGGLLGVGVYYLLAAFWELRAPQQMLVLVLPSLAVALYVVWLLPESLLRLFLLVIGRCVYRVRALGVENLPTGGALLVSNHVSYVDVFVLQIACPRPIRFIAYEAFHRKWWLGWALRILGVIPISARHAKEAIRITARELQAGELVCVFPEGQLTRTGTLMGLRKGFELMARQGRAPVVPVYLDSLWGSIFSFADQRYFWKLPRRWPYPALVNFGKPLPCDTVTAAIARQALLDVGEEAFQQRRELRGHLGRACFSALARQPWRPLVVDRFPQRRVFSRGMTLALAIALMTRWRRTIAGKRVGVVLPPGIGGTATNLALSFLGKTPVNLNFTAGRAALESCLRRAGIETVISADALRKRLADFPWPADTRDVAAEIKACSKSVILGWLAAVWLAPSAWLMHWLGIPRRGDREEAGLLFTSGSSGEPKGVVLSHRNILANVAQVGATGIMCRGDGMLACLPLFHSFGFTVTLWYPLLQGVRLVTLPSPLEVKKIAEAIREEQVTILFGTPTFLRPYLRKTDPADLHSLRLVIAGAEKLPADLAQGFKEKFNVPIFEGYGLTETSPVASVNLPDPPMTTSTAGPQSGSRAGSVGRLLPGMTARLVDPETGAVKGLLEIGMLHLRGPNIFEGYLGDEERTRQVIRDGWFVTGDLARFDEDGFLFIEGRLSRFSKIGGEMVPHGTVEQKIIELLALDASETQPVVVVGVPDETKGEALVLLTAVELAADQIREKLTAAGLPNLWIPKTIKRVEKIPTLGTGKLDLKACEKLAH